MRKKSAVFFVSLVMIFSFAWAVHAEGVIKVGVDVDGMVGTNHSAENIGKVGTGFTLGMELFREGQRRGTIGAGAEYQFIRNAKEFAEGFGFIPVYALARLKLPFFTATKPFILGKIGYSFFRVNQPIAGANYTGGLYYGLAAGLSLPNDMQLGVDYTVSNGEKQVGNSVFPYRYPKIGLSLGLLF